MEFIKQPWHWAIGGIIIGLIVPALLLLGNKRFGISSTLRHICAACFPANIPFFKYDWKKEIWNLFFAAGIVLGSMIAVLFMQSPEDILISDATKQMLAGWGISNFSGLMPEQIFNWNNLFTVKGLIFFIFSGFIIGFGTRYAGGCTSGHSIMGISHLEWSSVVATICFMIGGAFTSNFILPLIIQ